MSPLSAPNDQDPRADVVSLQQDPSRPALKDRQCTQREKVPRGKSYNKLPKAGNYTNGRLPRNSSANALPRGRSFQGMRPTSAAAQAAQDGYYQRKAAKLYAEKRRAAAAAHQDKEGSEDGTAVGNTCLNIEKTEDLYNITVDAKGVKIDSATGSSQPSPGMGQRKISRSRMTRSTSKQRSSMRLDDKENLGADAQRTPTAEIEAFFSRKRGSTDHIGRKKDPFPEHSAMWDGSMPKRQNSKSFIDYKKHGRALSDAQEPKSDGPDDHRIMKGDDDVKGTAALNESSTPDASTADTILSPSPTNDIQTNSTSSHAVETLRHAPAAQMNLTSGDQSAESGPGVQIADGSSSGSINQLSAPSSAALPLHGKWCDDCAGVGLHIAALLTQLEKQKSHSDNTSEGSSSSGGSKKGWKNIVLGESKSKSSSEKARLQQEISVLRATVEFLYKKVEQNEACAYTKPSVKA